MDNKQLYFEELETVEELGWVEAGVGTVIGFGIGINAQIAVNENKRSMTHERQEERDV